MAKLEHRLLHSTKLRSAAYDEATETLEIAFHDRSTLTYKSVPAEIARRLFSSPNPSAYWEDRIEEEYPSSKGRLATSDDARAELDDLFGGPAADRRKS